MSRFCCRHGCSARPGDNPGRPGRRAVTAAVTSIGLSARPGLQVGRPGPAAAAAARRRPGDSDAAAGSHGGLRRRRRTPARAWATHCGQPESPGRAVDSDSVLPCPGRAACPPRVAHPSPSRPSESPIRVAHPSRPSEAGPGSALGESESAGVRPSPIRVWNLALHDIIYDIIR
jgi:hypothetical protein